MKLCIPEKAIEQHVVVLGKTGAGKSSKLRHIVEHLLSKGKRVCVIDPKGDWYGLKLMPDGSKSGQNIIAFGDFSNSQAQDIPINCNSGKQIAELITTGNRPCIIGFRGWMPSDIVKFWLDFAPALFNAQAGELYLVIDEVHNFAPKGKILDPQAGKCIHWTNRLMSEGRGLGLICLIASQRPQKVHNDTLTCCETLIAARVIHKADRNAVKDWIEGCGDSDCGGKVLNGLAQLKRPEAWVWSPESGFGPEIISFPMFSTFDSFAPPQLQKKIKNADWNTIDLEDVKSKFKTVIEETKQNDPAELKKKIKELERTIATKQPQSPSQDEINKAIILEKELKQTQELKCEITQLLKAIEATQPATQRFLNYWASITDKNQKFEPVSLKRYVATPTKTETIKMPRLPFEKAAREMFRDKTLGRCERAILTALAQYIQGRTPVQVALLSEYSSSSGGFNNALSKLRSLEYITRDSPMRITPAGLEALGDYTPLPTGMELAKHWINKLPKCESMILQKLIDNYPGCFSAEEIGEMTGYSHSSGGFNNALSRLRTLQLINKGQPIRATEEFFQ